MEQIFAFFKNLYEEHLYLILAGVIVLALLIFFIIVISVKKKKAKQKKTQETFIQKSVQALTPQEIENISNNSANPVMAKETLTAEVVELNVEPTKEEVKPSVEPKKQEVKKAEPKKAKAEPKEVKKAEPKKADAEPKQVKKAEPKKADAEPKEVKKAEPKKADTEPKQVKKAEPKKAESKPVETTDDKKNYLGKWKIKDDENGFFACLTASNGVLVLQTEYYKSLSGVKNGIETIKKNVDDGNFAISVDKYGHYRYKLLSQSNRVICISEDYSSKAKCESGIESVKRFAKTAIVIREEQEK
ncbi:MAG: DUF1508 domain-containing protein [Clostridia bacterium]|nr:DUF1508 domain-containing protein [Clostridia bacterium]